MTSILLTIGEPILSDVISRLVDKATTSDFVNFVRKENLEVEIKKWHKTLTTLNAVLADAEKKKTTSESSNRVKVWLTNLRAIVYDVEDVLDEVNYEALRRKFTAKSQATSCSSKMLALIPSSCSSLSLSNVKFGSKLKDITTRLAEIVKEKNDLGLTEGSYAELEKRKPTTSIVDQSRVYGRKDDKHKIIELLMGGEASSEKLTVIPIIGMGGLGKTTLAQLIYDDKNVKAHFDLKAWICVSEDFDVFKITKVIWQYLTSETCHFDNIAFLQEKLKEKLSLKKFLIVIDDVWNANVDDWETLCLPFRTGVAGCKILVTTRNEFVMTTMNVTPHHLERLSVEDCKLILQDYALGGKTFYQFPSLEDVGIKIVEKCGCLPLAVKSLAVHLGNVTNLLAWEDALKSDIWDLPGGQNKILPALKLSYHYLPARLKSCFVYCSLFPKDYEFKKDELVSLWMAEGFLNQHEEKKKIEDSGCEYFDELLSRSFFQKSSINDKRYVMHDLMNDLARYVAIEEKLYLWLDEEMGVGEAYNEIQKVRHSSFVSSHYDIFKRFKKISELKHLRTFLTLQKGDEGKYSRKCFLSYDVLHRMLPEFKFLRVLSLYYYAISELPKNIGDLRLLRHLNLSGSHITRLPDTVAVLYNLETLILYQCSYLKELPLEIKNLIELHELDIAYTKRLQEMPSGISSLTKLHKLSKFVVSKGNKNQIRELQGLTHLRGKLSIYGLQNVQYIEDVIRANLKGKEGLDDIALIWSNRFDDSRDVELEMKVLDWLEPNENLKVLEIESYGGNDFPSWLGNPYFVNMERITLLGCEKSKWLPSLGRLPLLNYLRIEGSNGVESIGREFSGSNSFPKLDTLEFENMLNWVDWSCFDDAKEFLHLRKLKIINCPSLKGNLPSHLPSLVEVEISDCPQLDGGSPISLPSLAVMSIKSCNVSVVRSMVDLNSLTTCVMKEISGLSYLDEVLLKSLTKVVDLEIEDCQELTCLWKNNEGYERSEEPVQTRGMNLLKRFIVEKCKELISLWKKGQAVQAGGGLKLLEKVNIKNCGALETLPDWWMQRNSGNHQQCLLEELSIDECPLIKSLSRSNLSTTLKKLYIRNCDNLECLAEELMVNGHLEHLTISNCESLKSFLPGKFPVTLQELYLFRNEQLQQVLLSEERFEENNMLQCITLMNSNVGFGLGLGRLNHLTILKLYNCEYMVSLPKNTFMSTPNLRNLVMANCKNLKLLPCDMHELVSLQSLVLTNCPGIIKFPEGGLPPKLTELIVRSCEKMKQPISKWGLNTLTSLKELQLRGPIGSIDEEIVSFPDKDEEDGICILPSSLTEITISDFENMESISSNLQSLTSLQKLSFENCPKLKSLPKEGLPDSLGRLKIENCPIGERCIKEEKGGGDYWPHISHIPFIKIRITNNDNGEFHIRKYTYTAGCKAPHNNF